jgi:hypothetical protein
LANCYKKFPARNWLSVIIRSVVVPALYHSLFELKVKKYFFQAVHLTADQIRTPTWSPSRKTDPQVHETKNGPRNSPTKNVIKIGLQLLTKDKKISLEWRELSLSEYVQFHKCFIYFMRHLHRQKFVAKPPVTATLVPNSSVSFGSVTTGRYIIVLLCQPRKPRNLEPLSLCPAFLRQTLPM